MRPSLRHPIGERRHVRRGRRAHPPAVGRELGAVREPAVPPPPSAPEPTTEEAGSAPNRARAVAPTDRASYACHCGYLFVSTVTTTVRCPHCGASQAW